LQYFAAARAIGLFINDLKSVVYLIRRGWSSPCKRKGNFHTIMKKRNSSTRHDTPAHPNIINYLALIHAMTHPGTRPDPGKYHRSHKSATLNSLAS
jgi:hypothetical protein